MGKNFFRILFIFLFLLAPEVSWLESFAQPYSQYSQPIIISLNTVWHKEDKLIFQRPIVIVNGATLTIEKGTQIIFKNKKDFRVPLGIKVLKGKIIAQGETQSKIIFLSQDKTPFSLSIESKEQQSFFRYVKIIGGGYQLAFHSHNSNFNFFSKAYAFRGILGQAALEVRGGKIKVENTEFLNSHYADVETGIGTEYDKENQELKNVYLPQVTIVNSNFSFTPALVGNQCREYKEMLGKNNPQECSQSVFLKDNWYGFSQEEKKEKFKLQGDYLKKGSRKSSLILDPVVFIPGILGSDFNREGELKIDPIWHQYDDLLQSLQKNGFPENKKLFLFPYNWRFKNEVSAVLLREKIKQIQKETQISKVDIVAHSMGGLVARAYAEEKDYANNIDQMIFLGTPHQGAPKAFLMWEGGEGYQFLLARHLRHEAEENNYDELYQYVQEKTPSVKELLPVYSYLFDLEKNNLEKYPQGYPVNSFLEKLNATDNLYKLEKINIINIIGKTRKDNTIGKIRVNKSISFAEKKWVDGYPKDSDGDIENNLEKVSGDGTVPFQSAEKIPFNKEIILETTHTNLPTEAQCEIFSELTLLEKNKCQFIDNWHSPNWLLFHIFSPVDVQVIDPLKRKIGKDFSTGKIFNEIYGAYYSGYKTKKEFLAIPFPQEGKYRILTQGVGQGKYRIEVAYLSQNKNGEIIDSQIIYQGKTSLQEENQQVFFLKDNLLSKEETNQKDYQEENKDNINHNVDNNVILESLNNSSVSQNKHQKKDSSDSQKQKKKNPKKNLKSKKIIQSKKKLSFSKNKTNYSEKIKEENYQSKENLVTEKKVKGEENNIYKIKKNNSQKTKKNFLKRLLLIIGIVVLTLIIFGWKKIFGEKTKE